MSIKLRDLIRAVRACKTAAEERAVISKECALIRTTIKEEDEQFRHRNVAKLMFIHMLGYPTHFGQMETLKLISSQGFPEKRIGYLGLTLLLTEQTEVLTLVTNSMKVDLTNNNQYIQALSLIAIGNLATQDMARDLASDVEKLLKSNNSYLRKKAALATIRLLKKEPDLIDHMSERIVALLKDRSHGVLITGMQLIIEVLEMLPEWKGEYLKLVPSLVRLLRNFLSMGFSPEYDVAGIADPFMQVKILRLLRLLGEGNEEASEQMNDVLAQVATNTETTKNAGNAILYECVQTIMGVQSDASLRVLAVNILGRFLLNRDNNIRYVALNSLSKVVSEDIAAVQRHRNTIVDCLKDPDISIRLRALELIYQLVNEQNVMQLTNELLNYLVVAPSDHRPNLVSKIIMIIERYSPNKKWRVDTVITMLSIAGNVNEDSVPRTAIIFIAQAEGLQGYAAHRLYRSLKEDSSQLALLQVAVWCIGEYGGSLTQPSGNPDPNDPDFAGYSAVPEGDVLDLLDKCTRLHNVDLATKALIINALVKLTVRFSTAARDKVLQYLAPFQHSMSLELQQRSTEYAMLLKNTSQYEALRKQLLDKMPVLDEAAIRRRRAVLDDESPNSPSKAAASNGSTGIDSMLGGGGNFSAPSGASNGASGASLLDLDDIFGGSPAPTPAPAMVPAAAASAPAAAAAAAMSNNILDIFGAPPVAVPQVAAMPPAAPAAQPSFIAVAPVQNPVVKAFEKGAMTIIMELSKPNPADTSQTSVLCKFSNLSAQPLENLVFQAAVPKYLKLEMLPPSSTTIPPNSQGAVTQEIKLANSMQGQKNIMLKLKIGYRQGGAQVDEMAQVSNFPPLF